MIINKEMLGRSNSKVCEEIRSKEKWDQVSSLDPQLSQFFIIFLKSILLKFIYIKFYRSFTSKTIGNQ